MKNMKILGIAALVILSLVVLPTTTAMGQEQSPQQLQQTLESSKLGPGGELAANLINQTQVECQPFTIIVQECAELVYASDRTVIFDGNYLINLNVQDVAVFGQYATNSFLWQIVDELKANGYTINTVTTAGLGTQDNPLAYHIVMSK
jgi:hypothetical protein